MSSVIVAHLVIVLNIKTKKTNQSNLINQIINNTLDKIDANSFFKPSINTSNILPSQVLNFNLNNYFKVPEKTQNGVEFSLFIGSTIIQMTFWN